MLLHNAPPVSAQRRAAATTAALSLLACFLLALAGHGIHPTPGALGKVAVSNRDAGTATIPRQGVPVRIAATSHREHAKSPTESGGLGLPVKALAIIALAPDGTARAVAAQRPTVEIAHYPRGPPRSASRA